MKAELPTPKHYSYIKYRKQAIKQVVLPVVLSAILMVGMVVWISLATFNDGVDVGRWAAISTMWIIIPVMIGGLVVMAILGGLIYLMIMALKGLPYYTGTAQTYVYQARSYIVRGANMAVKPVIALNGWIETIKAFFERISP